MIPQTAAHPNSVHGSQFRCPSDSPQGSQQWRAPSAIIFAAGASDLFTGKQAWSRVLLGASMASETTGRGDRRGGTVRRDPMAMLPSAATTLPTTGRTGQPPSSLTNCKIFHVNCSAERDHSFMWPDLATTCVPTGLSSAWGWVQQLRPLWAWFRTALD
jgi:phosphoenolpyruvate carboxykinase (GTP)